MMINITYTIDGIEGAVITSIRPLTEDDAAEEVAERLGQPIIADDVDILSSV